MHSLSYLYWKFINHITDSFLDAPSHLYKRVWPSGRRSVTPSLRWLLGASYAEYSALLSYLIICYWLLSRDWSIKSYPKRLWFTNSLPYVYPRPLTDVDIAGVHSKFMITLLRDPQPDNTSIILLMVVCLFAGDRPHLSAPAKDFIDKWQLRWGITLERQEVSLWNGLLIYACMTLYVYSETYHLIGWKRRKSISTRKRSWCKKKNHS